MNREQRQGVVGRNYVDEGTKRGISVSDYEDQREREREREKKYI